MRIPGTWMALLIAFVASGLVLATTPHSAHATVPIPYTLCEVDPTKDLLKVNSITADYYPPVGSSAPLMVTATVEGGMLTSLRIDFFLAPDWIFQSVGQLGFVATPDFVTLPPSLSMDVIAPALPLAAGPYHTSRSFGSPPGVPDTIYADTTLKAPVSAPLTADVTLLFDGVPGFPTKPTSGTFEAQIRVSEPSGPEVFCLDVKYDIICELSCFEVIVVPTAPAPAMSKPGLLLGVLLLTGIGIVGLARRRIRSSGERFR
jgi:hypothetical protein